MGPWDAFTQGFGNAFAQAYETKNRKKMMEQEQANRLALLQAQSRLENEALTPEMKLMRMYQQNPGGFSAYRQALDPGLATDQTYKLGMLGVQQGQLGLDQKKLDILSRKNPEGITNQQKNFQFLMNIPGMTQEKALQMVFRPDLMQQFLSTLGANQSGTGGGGFNQGSE